MTHNEHWELNYHDIMAFMLREKRRPSKYNLEEHQMYNWLKYQKKCLIQGRLSPQRTEMFKKLLELLGQYQRKNQYAYLTPPSSGNNYCGDLFGNDI